MPEAALCKIAKLAHTAKNEERQPCSQECETVHVAFIDGRVLDDPGQCPAGLAPAGGHRHPARVVCSCDGSVQHPALVDGSFLEESRPYRRKGVAAAVPCGACETSQTNTSSRSDFRLYHGSALTPR